MAEKTKASRSRLVEMASSLERQRAELLSKIQYSPFSTGGDDATMAKHLDEVVALATHFATRARELKDAL